MDDGERGVNGLSRVWTRSTRLEAWDAPGREGVLMGAGEARAARRSGCVHQGADLAPRSWRSLIYPSLVLPQLRAVACGPRNSPTPGRT